MTVAAPPRPPSQAPEARDSKPLEREEIEALVEALIEEARREQRRRHRRYWALAAFATFVGVVVLILLDGGAASQPTSSALAARSSLSAAAATPRIAFISAPQGLGQRIDGGLYVVNADGSGKQQLTSARYSTPAWSPDGRRIAFGAGSNVWVMNADGSEPLNLTPDPGGGQRSCLVARRAEDRLRAATHGDLRDERGRQRAATAGPHTPRRVVAPLLPGRRTVGRSRSSADATDLFRVEATEISVVNADGSGQRNLTRNPASDSDPVWSPDGRKITFVRNFEIYVMNADGSGQTNLTRNPAHDFAPAWSPDGQRIVFERRLARRQYGACPGCGGATIFEVHVMNADGSGPRRLTRNAGQVHEGAIGARPRWSPDGRQIAFVSGRDGNADIYVMNADGSGQRNLTRNARGHDTVFAWSPAQK